MPVNKESELVSNKEAQADAKSTESQRAKIQVDADKARAKQSKELSSKFGKDRDKDKEETLQRMKDIKKMLRDGIRKDSEANNDIADFALALQEKRADLPNKLLLTVEEFNDFRNDIAQLKLERDRANQSSEDSLEYVFQKVSADSIG